VGRKAAAARSIPPGFRRHDRSGVFALQSTPPTHWARRGAGDGRFRVVRERPGSSMRCRESSGNHRVQAALASFEGQGLGSTSRENPSAQSSAATARPGWAIPDLGLQGRPRNTVAQGRGGGEGHSASAMLVPISRWPRTTADARAPFPARRPPRRIPRSWSLALDSIGPAARGTRKDSSSSPTRTEWRSGSGVNAR